MEASVDIDAQRVATIGAGLDARVAETFADLQSRV
jgi:hypothetical protein